MRLRWGVSEATRIPNCDLKYQRWPTYAFKVGYEPWTIHFDQQYWIIWQIWHFLVKFGDKWDKKAPMGHRWGYLNTQSISFRPFEIKIYGSSVFVAVKYRIGFIKFTIYAKNDDFSSNLATMRLRWGSIENPENSKINRKCSQYLRPTHHLVKKWLN